MWIWALQEGLGGTLLSVLTGVTSRHLAFKRSNVAEATGEFDLAHEDAYTIIAAMRDSMPILRCFHVEQANAAEVAVTVVRFAGIVLPLEENAEAGTLKLTARGVGERLEGRQVGSPDLVWARDNTDVGDVLAELLDDANTEQYTGIELGEVESSIALDVEYEGKPVADVFNELTGVQGGPDIEIVPVADDTGQGAQLGRLEVYASQGQYRDEAVFGYGKDTVANCTDATRQTTRPANRVIVYGDEGTSGFAEDIASQDKYNLWTVTESMGDVVDVGVLDARAEALLQPEPVRFVSFQPDPAHENVPLPFAHYWLGDTVPLTVRKGAFEHDGIVRIDGIDIDIDDDTGEDAAHTITVATDEG